MMICPKHILNLFFLILLFALSLKNFAQDTFKTKTENEYHLNLPINDSLSLQNYFVKSHWQIHSRNFFMSTINEGKLKDDYALASGIGLGIVTDPLYGFQFGFSGFFIHNLFSSELILKDSLTGGNNRYEIGLFDIENPSNTKNLVRLEDLYIKYSLSKSYILFGKININTPFFNPQDGRMRPTLEEGLWLHIGESEKVGFNGGWIWGISPRSTLRWFSIEESFGINGMGVNSTGHLSNYKHNIKSSGAAVLNAYIVPGKKIKINLWNALIMNVMNTLMLEINQQYDFGDYNLYNNLMFVHQNAINQGGNKDQTKAYLQKGTQSNSLSYQLGIKKKRINFSLAYTRITSDGQYLMPREWGKEPFYTFMPRERNEGLGNVHALSLKNSIYFNENRGSLGIAYGYYHLPDVKNYRLNKYGLPTYHQINIESIFRFQDFLKGLEVKGLLVFKKIHKNTDLPYYYIYNKVNLLNFSLVLEFKL